MNDRHASVEAFLEASAAKQPTPGGGAIAALTGALAASMGEMVLNYSVGKKSLAAYVGELTPALAEFTQARNMLLELMEEDQAAYEAMTAARKLPETHPERAQTIHNAVITGIRVPQAIGTTALAIIEIADRVVNFVNPYLISDLAVCTDLAMATVRCSTYNVRVNLPSLSDEAERRQYESWINQTMTRAGGVIQQASRRIISRMIEE